MSFGGLFDDDMIPKAGGLFDDDIPYAGAGVPAGAPRLPGLSLGPNQQTDGERQRREMSSMALIAPSSGGDGDSAGRNKEEEENDTRSGSEDVEGVSGDDAEQENPRKKKWYHRHTPQQILELEALFKECEHPDEKQRMELCLEFGSSSTSDRDQIWIASAGRSSMLKLAQRMTDNFCAGVSPSSAHKWTPLVGSIGEDVMRVMARQSLPGEPPGAVLSAATSVWLPVAPGRLFDFLQDECLRSEWDILSNGGPLQEMAHIAKGQDHGNAVSLFRLSNAVSALILQETCTDSFGSLVVYAPVDISAMHLVMNGGDSDYVALLPSGFAIAPDLLPSEFAIAPDGPPSGDKRGGGSLLTVAFQILAKSLPGAMTEESAETMKNLISCTVQKIMAAFPWEN